MRAFLANSAWLAASHPARARFLAEASRAESVQARLLAWLLEVNADTEFGRAHGFSTISNLREYRRRVPIRSYEEFVPWIGQAADGRAGVLTAEPILLFEPTGGSTGGSRLIPYTRSLHREFQRAIGTWVADIFRTIPGALRGTSYWSVSPPAQDSRKTAGGTPIGFADDVEYLGGRARWVRHAMAAPAALTRIADPDRFIEATALALLQRSDLSILSIWNPSFLLLLLSRIRSELPALIRVLHPRRARAVELAFRDPAGAFERVWPRLRLISCWTDAAARPFAESLRHEFRGVRMQGKGLLATEGFVTLPLFAAGGCVPAYQSHVLEFQDDEGGCYGVHELDADGEYAVILSTGGGLYRYALGDRVRVTGAYAGLPVLAFTGRPLASDLVGEKLDARHAQRVIEEAFAGAGIAPRFALLAPESDAQTAGYVLFLETGTASANDARLQGLGDAIERGLRENVQYEHARSLGQLAPLRIFLVRGGGLETFLRRSTAEGQSLGDVKPTALDRRTGWTGWFDGDILSAHPALVESTLS